MRRTRMHLAAVAALAVPFLCAAAQGTPALAATLKTPSATPAITNCSPFYSVGHKTSADTETWSYIGGDTHLYFYGSGPRTSLCQAQEFIYLQNNGTQCLKAVTGGPVTAVTCNTSQTDQEWLILATDGPYYTWALKNIGTNQCLYENTQEPAIMASCTAEATDKFEWFYWPIG
jgi:hypothetical protein